MIIYHNYRNTDYWYDKDAPAYDCAGYAPSSRGAQRLNQSVDSCRSLKPIITLSTTAPKSAPPITEPNHADKLENANWSSVDINELETSTESVITAQTGETKAEDGSEKEVEEDHPKAEDSNDLKRPSDLRIDVVNPLVCITEVRGNSCVFRKNLISPPSKFF